MVKLYNEKQRKYLFYEDKSFGRNDSWSIISDYVCKQSYNRRADIKRNKIQKK